jgi:hypothetical protein
LTLRFPFFVNTSSSCRSSGASAMFRLVRIIDPPAGILPLPSLFVWF